MRVKFPQIAAHTLVALTLGACGGAPSAALNSSGNDNGGQARTGVGPTNENCKAASVPQKTRSTCTFSTKGPDDFCEALTGSNWIDEPKAKKFCEMAKGKWSPDPCPETPKLVGKCLSACERQDEHLNFYYETMGDEATLKDGCEKNKSVWFPAAAGASAAK